MISSCTQKIGCKWREKEAVVMMLWRLSLKPWSSKGKKACCHTDIITPHLRKENDFVEKIGQSTKTSDTLTLKTWRSKIRKTCCHIHAGEHRHRHHYTLNEGKQHRVVKFGQYTKTPECLGHET